VDRAGGQLERPQAGADHRCALRSAAASAASSPIGPAPRIATRRELCGIGFSSPVRLAA
jgi:hypothetical protein